MRKGKSQVVLAGLVGASVGVAAMLIIFLLFSGILSSPLGISAGANISDRECWPLAQGECGPKLYAGLSSNSCDHNYYFSANTVQHYSGKVITPQNFTLLGQYVDLGNPPGTCMRPICFAHRLPVPFWDITLIIGVTAGLVASTINLYIRKRRAR